MKKREELNLDDFRKGFFSFICPIFKGKVKTRGLTTLMNKILNAIRRLGD
ncbi:MAG: hypothetical protein JW976_07250 [Syntrophaceae bacterium]|nr:hypothetical protein [Syntrophaceae bacterium]